MEGDKQRHEVTGREQIIQSPIMKRSIANLTSHMEDFMLSPAHGANNIEDPATDDREVERPISQSVEASIQ